jgi:guanylate kinase
LKKRSTESEDKINMRAKASRTPTAPQFDVIIKNYDLDTALEEAHQLVKSFVSK